MSSISHLQKPAEPDRPALPQAQAQQLMDTIWGMFSLLSVGDQQAVVDRLTSAVRLIPASRAGDVLGTVVRFLPKKPEWTAEEIRNELAATGVEASSQAVFNAIGYLVRKGHIRRLGGGRYLIGGVGFQGQLDFEGHDE